MDYRLPESTDEQALKAYVREHHENNETSVSASHGLPVMDYAVWLDSVRKNASEGNAEWGRSFLLLCLEDDRLIGLLSIRWELPGQLAARYGHIGYSVRPSERGKGYATEMLRHALTVCREQGLKEVILGCYRDNAASASVILKCGGVLTDENENYTKGRISRYYTVSL